MNYISSKLKIILLRNSKVDSTRYGTEQPNCFSELVDLQVLHFFIAIYSDGSHALQNCRGDENIIPIHKYRYEIY